MEHIILSTMIKDEAAVICRTLKSYLDIGIETFLIYDTGSTDGTVDILRKFFKKNNCRKYKILIEKFIDFSVSRNRALDHAFRLFPHKTYNLMIDSEWYITESKGLSKFLTDNKNNRNIDVYPINMFYGCNFKKYIMFRNNGKARFKEPVHEYVVGNFGCVVPDTTIIVSPSITGIDKSKERWERDLLILADNYKKTNEPRSCFYLARTYDDLGDSLKAIEYYNERVNLDGFCEEIFISFYRMGCIYELLGDWDLAFKNYMKAFNSRKTRAEPLIRIAKHFTDPKYKYIYSKHACQISYPESDLLFVEKNLYDYDRWDQLAISAFYSGTIDESFDAILKTIQYNPKITHVRNNFKIICSKKGINPEMINRILEISQKEFYDKSKVLNLILYSENIEYKQMYKILSSYLKKNDILHFFYCFKDDDNFFENKDIKIIDDIIYFKGKESFIPGILDKTLKVFDFFKNYDFDYIVRSNISSLIDWRSLNEYLINNKCDYWGPVFYYGSFIDLQSGLTKEKNELYGKHPFVSGICIVLSKAFIQKISSMRETIMSYGIIDDVAIGIFFGEHCNDLKRGNLGLDTRGFNVTDKIDGVIVYRNKRENRYSDIQALSRLTL